MSQQGNEDSAAPIIERVEDPEQLLAQIIECVQARDSRGLKTYILEHKLKKESIFWELTLKIGVCITEQIFEESPGFFDVCERCLNYLVKVGNPKEMLLAILEQMETFIDDLKYKTFLMLLQITILSIPGKLFHSLDVTLETVSAHIRSLPLPENVQLEGEELKLFHADKIVVRLADILLAFLQFIKPFVESCKLDSSEASSCATVHEAMVLKKHLVHILDHPLIHLILTWDPDKPKSDTRTCVELAISLLVLVETNLHRLIENASLSRSLNGSASVLPVQKNDDNDDGGKGDVKVDEASATKEETDNEKNETVAKQKKGMEDESRKLDIVEMWDFKMVISVEAEACLVYLLYVENLGREKYPLVYRHDYELEFNLESLNFLLGSREYLVNVKGLLLCASLVKRIDNGSMSCQRLDNPGFSTVANNLIEVMTKCPVQDNRTLAVNVFPSYIKLFDGEGRYQLYQTIFSSCSHSGVKGLIITILKDDIRNFITRGKDTKFQDGLKGSTGLGGSENQTQMFNGAKLKRILLLALNLPDKETSDMLENSDQIISSLNLLTFLVLADPADINVTGFWNFLPSVEESFVEPLRRGLELSKAHYSLELQNVKDGTDTPGSMDMSVSAGGMALPKMEKQEKVNVVGRALNTHDLMHCLLARLTDLIGRAKRDAA